MVLLPAMRRSVACALRNLPFILLVIAVTPPAAAGMESADRALQTATSQVRIGAAGKTKGAGKAAAVGRKEANHHTLVVSEALAAAAKSAVMTRCPESWCPTVVDVGPTKVGKQSSLPVPHAPPLLQSAKDLAALGHQTSMAARFNEVHNKAKAHERLGHKAQT